MEKTMVTGKLGNLGAGSSLIYGGIKWVLLKKEGDAGFILARDNLPEKRAFDEKSNNFAYSELKDWLNGPFLTDVCKKSGTEPDIFVEMTVDLTADNGREDYGVTRATIALISCEQYRRFRFVTPPASDWCWTCTPYSVKKNGHSNGVRGIHTDGTLHHYGVCSGKHGVRPFCCLRSSALISYSEEYDMRAYLPYMTSVKRSRA
jgi:hypothetical protein